jgi:hypothetical protein
MGAIERDRLRQLQAEREAAARESQALISRGEDLLDRAHRVARQVERRVRRVLGRRWGTGPGVAELTWGRPGRP